MKKIYCLFIKEINKKLILLKKNDKLFEHIHIFFNN